jgi:hypothetical protein
VLVKFVDIESGSPPAEGSDILSVHNRHRYVIPLSLASSRKFLLNQLCSLLASYVLLMWGTGETVHLLFLLS